MKIALEDLRGIVGHANFTLSGENQHRRTGRVGVSKRVMLSRKGSAVRIPVTMIDASTGGIGLVHIAPLEKDDHVILRIHRKDQDPLVVQCAVAWCRKTATKRYRTGATYEGIVEEENLSPADSGRTALSDKSSELIAAVN